MDLTTIIILIIAVLVTVFIMWLLPKFNISVPIETVFKNVPANLNSIKEMTEVINVSQETKDVIKSFIDAATIGVNCAEKLYKTKQLSSDERKKAAFETARDLLKLNNIEVDEKQERLIQSVIESVVLTLPKTH